MCLGHNNCTRRCHLAAPLTTRSNAAQNVYERQRSASGPPSSQSDSSCAEEHITSGVP